MCDQQRLRPACEYAQSNQSLCKSFEYSMTLKLLTEHHLEFLSLKGGCTGSYESTLVKMPHCWKSHFMAHILPYISTYRPLVKSAYQNIIFLITQPKHMLWELKRTVSMRRFFWAPKTYVQTDGFENIYNFTLKNFVYLNLCTYLIYLYRIVHEGFPIFHQRDKKEKGSHQRRSKKHTLYRSSWRNS